MPTKFFLQAVIRGPNLSKHSSVHWVGDMTKILAHFQFCFVSGKGIQFGCGLDVVWCAQRVEQAHACSVSFLTQPPHAPVLRVGHTHMFSKF